MVESVTSFKQNEAFNNPAATVRDAEFDQHVARFQADTPSKKSSSSTEKSGVPYKDGGPLNADTVRPEGDTRSADQIIKDNPIYANLAEKDKQTLRDRCGDIEHDADAAFRAVQVLHRIEKYDENGDPVTGDTVGNGRIDGWTRGNRDDPMSEAQHGTESGRFQDFGKYGWDSLKGPKTNAEPFKDDHPGPDNADKLVPYKDGDSLGPSTARPDGDLRSATQIIADNPIYAQLSEKDKQALRDKCGDIEHDGDAAFRAVQVLHQIEGYDEKGDPVKGSTVGNNSIDGWTRADRNDPNSEAEHGTEAGRFQDFTKYGWDTLKGPHKNVEPPANVNPDEDAGISKLQGDALAKAVKDAGGDPTKVKPEYFTQDGYDSFKNASAADKLAMLQQLSEAAAKLNAGLQYYTNQAYEIGTGTAYGPPPNSNADDWHHDHPGEPTPGEQQQAVLDGIQKDISKISQDPDVQKFINDKFPAATKDFTGGTDDRAATWT